MRNPKQVRLNLTRRIVRNIYRKVPMCQDSTAVSLVGEAQLLVCPVRIEKKTKKRGKKQIGLVLMMLVWF